MKVERTSDEILIRLPANIDVVGLQRLLDFLKVRETASKSTATEDQIEQLSEESNADWWAKNKSRFIK